MSNIIESLFLLESSKTTEVTYLHFPRSNSRGSID